MNRHLPSILFATAMGALILSPTSAFAQLRQATSAERLLLPRPQAERKATSVDLHRKQAEQKAKYPMLFKARIIDPKGANGLWDISVRHAGNLAAVSAGQGKTVQQPMMLKAQTVPLGRQLWANVLQSSRWEADAAEYGIYTFGTSSSMDVSAKYTSPYMFANAGGALAGKRLDIITYSSAYGSMLHYYFDAETGEFQNGNYLNDYSLWATETAVAADGTIYGDFYSADATRFELGVVDYARDTRTTIGQLYHYYVAMGITKDNELYGIATDGKLYRIDLEDAKETLIGSTGVNLTMSDGTWNAQSGEIDQATGIFYWACTDNTNHSALYTVDLATGLATKVGDMSGNEQMVLLSIPKETVNSDAPALASNFNVAFDQASLSGTVSFTAPTTAYMGETLTGTLSYTVTIDDVAVKTGSVVPGGSVSEPVSTTRGNHVFAVTLSNASGEGPRAYMTRFVGDDTPQAARNVKATLDVATGKVNLTWDAVTSGVNGGYISNVVYDVVRYPGKTRVVSGTSATRAEDVLPSGALTGYYYTVVAVSGAQESEVSSSNSVTFGDVPEPPFNEGFDSEADLSLFTIVDGNNDGNTWAYCTDDNQGGSAVQIEYGNDDHDDWLITPPLKLKAGEIYNISYRVASKGSSYPEVLEVMYGGEPTAKAMTHELVESSMITNQQYATVKKELVPEKDGVYYFGFHCTSDANWCWRLLIDDISVVGNSQKSPDAITELTVTPAANGSNQAVVKFTTPSTAIDGSQLDGDLEASIMRDGEEIQAMAALTPGKEYTYTDNEPVNGFNTYSVVAKNEAGVGRESKAVKVYVGMDVPGEVKGIQATTDESSIKLTWNPVTTGDNGGYIDPTEIVYNVYEIIETSTGVNLPLVDQVDETTITIPYNTNEGDQEMINYALSAENSLSEGPRVMSPGILVGKPYELPFEEHFKGGALDNSMWWISKTGSSEYQLMQGLSADGDGGCAGYISVADNDSGTLGSGKISLLNAVNPTLVFSHMATVANCGGKTTVYVQKPDDSIEELCVVDYAAAKQGEWATTSVAFGPEYTSLPFVKLTFVTSVPTGTTIYFDNIYVRNMVDKDLQATLSVPARVRKGETVMANIEVANMGSTEVSPYTVNLYVGDKVAATKTIDTPLVPYSKEKVQLAYKTTVMDASPLQLKAEVAVDGDATPEDNVAFAEVELLASTKTAPGNVTATADSHSVKVAWGKVSETSETVTDDFESYTPWSMDEFGEWTGTYTEKGLAKGPFSRSYPHPNEGKRFAYTLVQPESWITSQILDDYACLKPESGNCYLAAFYGVENSQFIVADNWLISPSLTGEAQTVSFWANNFTAGTINYPEDFEVLYSTSGTTLDDFMSTGKTFTAEGGVWKEYTVDLPEGTTYFAIHNNTADTYMFMIDNITYRAGCGKVIGYNIYRDGMLLTQLSADTDNFIDDNVASGSHTYGVSAVYAGGESEATPATVLVSIDGVTVVLPQAFDVYTTDGKRVSVGVSSLKGLPAGVYVINNKFKVIVK